MEIALTLLLLLITSFLASAMIEIQRRSTEIEPFFKDLLKRVEKLANNDTLHGQPAYKRLQELEAWYTYKQFRKMCIKFWIPLEDFVKDKPFLK